MLAGSLPDEHEPRQGIATTDDHVGAGGGQITALEPTHSLVKSSRAAEFSSSVLWVGAAGVGLGGSWLLVAPPPLPKRSNWVPFGAHG